MKYLKSTKIVEHTPKGNRMELVASLERIEATDRRTTARVWYRIQAANCSKIGAMAVDNQDAKRLARRFAPVRDGYGHETTREPVAAFRLCPNEYLTAPVTHPQHDPTWLVLMESTR